MCARPVETTNVPAHRPIITCVGQVGANGVAVLAALDGAHTARFGAPTPTAVNHAPTAGKAILVRGRVTD